MIKAITVFSIAITLFFTSTTPANAQKHIPAQRWTIEMLPIEAVTFKKAFTARKKNISRQTDYRKKNGILTLPLANGKKVVFKDNKGVPYDEDRKSCHYLGQVNVLGAYLVKQNLYESTEYILINRKSGRMDTLAGKPDISPDGKTLFNTLYNPYEEHADVSPPSQDIYLSVITLGKISKPYRISYNKMMITGYAWETNSTLVICYKLKEEDKANEVRYARLRLIK
jgi:hypothetical protein